MSGRPMRRAFFRTVTELLEQSTLYITIDYVTLSHLCACCCGAEVVLPLHPTKVAADLRWRDSIDGAVDRKPDLTMPIALLDRQRPHRLG